MIESDKTNGVQFSDWLKWGGVALFIGWLFFSLSAYYVVQKPFSGPQLAFLAETAVIWQRFPFSAAAVGRSLLDVAAALWMAWFALGAGLWLLERFRLEMSPGARLLFGLGLGFGALGLLTLFLGMVGWLETAVFYAIAIILTLLTSKKAFECVRRLRWERPSRPAAVYLFLALGMALTLALLPPTSFDALFYHLKGPKLYLAAGRIHAYDIFPLHYPALFEMLFMMAMALRSDVTAKLLHFIFHLMLAGLIFQTARKQLRMKEGWTAVLLLYAIPMILSLAGWAYNDLGLAFYQIGALYFWLTWRQNRQSSWLLLSGIFCGLAMGFKYTSFVAPLTLAGFTAWTVRKRLSAMFKPLALLTAATTLTALPIYLKSWLLVGNPVYPFGGGRYWDNYLAAAFTESGTGLGLDLIAILRLPYDLTLGLIDVNQDAQIGPLLLAFLPLILILAFSRRRKDVPAALSWLLLFALSQYGFWLLGAMNSKGFLISRVLLPCFAALVPALAWLLNDLRRLDHPQFSLHRFLNLVIGLVLLLNLVGQITAWLPFAPWTYVVGSDTKAELLRRHLGAHYGAMEAINELPPESVVAFLFEPRSYYCDHDCRPDSSLDELGHLVHLHGDADGIAANWRESGVTHLLLYQKGYEFMTAARLQSDEPVNTAVVQALQTHHLTPITDIAGAYILYELQP